MNHTTRAHMLKLTIFVIDVADAVTNDDNFFCGMGMWRNPGMYLDSLQTGMYLCGGDCFPDGAVGSGIFVKEDWWYCV